MKKYVLINKTDDSREEETVISKKEFDKKLEHFEKLSKIKNDF